MNGKTKFVLFLLSSYMNEMECIGFMSEKPEFHVL
jgi:hypothetical protein